MSHFAKINSNNIVTEVIVSEKDFINSGQVGDEFLWVQCSYNNNFRRKFPSVGFTYDSANGVFQEPKPYPSWVLNSDHNFEAPVDAPAGGSSWSWDEDTTSWQLIE